MINELAKCIGGICINNMSFNVFNYADDLMLTSLSVTGLQDDDRWLVFSANFVPMLG